MPFINVFQFTLLHFNSIKLGLLYFTSLQLLIIKAVFEARVYFKCIFEFRSLNSAVASGPQQLVAPATPAVRLSIRPVQAEST